MLCGTFPPPTVRRSEKTGNSEAARENSNANRKAFGTPEVCKRKDASGIFSRRKVPSQERKPYGAVRLEGVPQKSASLEQSAVVRQKGLEPPTYCLEGSCSIRMSYWRIWSE